jgi:hypothetical protein
MGTWMLSEPTSGNVLLRQFAFLGLVVIGVITLVLSLMVSSVLRRDLLDREWITTADYVRAHILSHLTPAVLANPETVEATERFERFFRQVVTMPEVFRVKVYAADGTVLWSDESQLIGRRFADNPHLNGALAGQTVVNMESGGRRYRAVQDAPAGIREHSAEPSHSGRDRPDMRCASVCVAVLDRPAGGPSHR